MKTARGLFTVEILNERVGVLDDVLTSSGEGLGYPFDFREPLFYERCLKAEKCVEQLVKNAMKNPAASRRVLRYKMAFLYLSLVVSV